MAPFRVKATWRIGVMSHDLDLAFEGWLGREEEKKPHKGREEVDIVLMEDWQIWCCFFDPASKTGRRQRATTRIYLLIL